MAVNYNSLNNMSGNREDKDDKSTDTWRLQGNNFFLILNTYEEISTNVSFKLKEK